MLNNEVILGRDGLGDAADEAFFDAWVAYVAENIDEATGLDVMVSGKHLKQQVQNDCVIATDEVAKEVIKEAIQTLWDRFCSQS